MAVGKNPTVFDSCEETHGNRTAPPQPQTLTTDNHREEKEMPPVEPLPLLHVSPRIHFRRATPRRRVPLTDTQRASDLRPCRPQNSQNIGAWADIQHLASHNQHGPAYRITHPVSTIIPKIPNLDVKKGEHIGRHALSLSSHTVSFAYITINTQHRASHEPAHGAFRPPKRLPIDAYQAACKNDRRWEYRFEDHPTREDTGRRVDTYVKLLRRRTHTFCSHRMLIRTP